MFNESPILELVAILVIIISVVLDPLRDAWMSRGNDIDWWKRHIAKWGQFYPPLIFIAAVHTQWWFWPILGLMCCVLWQASLVRFAKKDWGGSRWLKLLKRFTG